MERADRPSPLPALLSPTSSPLSSPTFGRVSPSLWDKEKDASLYPSEPPRRASTAWRRITTHPASRVVLLLLCVGLMSLVPSFTFPVNRILDTPHRPNSTFRDSFHLPPIVPLDPALIETRAPTAEHTVTAIMLHGLGDDFHGLLPVVDKLAEAVPYVRWVLPQARIMNVTVRDGAPTSSWFNIATFEDLHQDEDLEGMIESQRQINALIAQERAAFVSRGVTPRIVVGGFSQGAVMSLLAVLTAEDNEAVEAAIVLSAYVPIPSRLNELAPFVPRGVPVYWGHGEADPYLTLSHASEGVLMLRATPFSLRNLIFKVYEGVEHYWSMEELDNLRSWFVNVVPAERRPKPTRPVAVSSEALYTSVDEVAEDEGSEDEAELRRLRRT